MADKWQQHRWQVYNDTVWPTLARQVRTGDMVLRLGSDITSEMLRQMNLTDKRYSHCGIASKEGDSIFVYHAIGGEFNPDQKIKREPLFSFAHPADNKSVAIYRPRSGSGQRIADTAAAYHRRGIPFDMQFDYATEDRFYCAEYVAKTLIRGLSDSGWLQFSVQGRLRYIAVDNLFHNRLMAPIYHAQY
ncbi:MAG: hypothetical protein MUF62_03130 [Chitinophagaceae bacterium]|nr:hypothetical protein [Chitinophagaceae bacterium]